MKQITVKLPIEMINALDEIIEIFGYPSRNEAIRLMLRDAILEHRKFKRAAKAFRFLDQIAVI